MTTPDKTPNDRAMFFDVGVKIIELMGRQAQSTKTLDVCIDPVSTAPVISRSMLIDTIETTIGLLKKTSSLIDGYASPSDWPGYWSNHRSNLESFYKAMGLLSGLSLTFQGVCPSLLDNNEKTFVAALCQNTIDEAYRLRSLAAIHDLAFDQSECACIAQKLQSVLRTLTIVVEIKIV